MKINLDLHIHSKYSAAVSRNMDLPEIAKEAALKGVKIVGTGDCLFPKWLDEIKELPFSDGLFRLDDIYFVLTVEVEDAHRVHHLILVPDVSKAEELKDRFSPKSSTLETDGRPKVHMEGAEIADNVIDAGCMIGPSHAFTPWTGIYAHYKSLTDCYKEHAESVRYLELGLSADTDYADRIAELSNRMFMSNSDAHSPRSNKLAREFNQMELKNMSFNDIKMAIDRHAGRHPTLNIGFYPEEGKYNRTACTNCYTQYSAEQMKELRGKCSVCGGIIKLGVKDRVDSLADYAEPVHPPHRPPYLHLIPLAEIIAKVIGNKSPYTAGVQKRWKELVNGRTEIEVLVEADLEELKAEPKIIQAIDAFRLGKVTVKPGGGGKYGEILLPESLAENPTKGQRSILEF
ncbi:MAG: TIGR00375 family protein [Methanotrichaceae archaeon]